MSKKILEMLISRGYFLSPCVDIRQVKNLVERMHPRKTGIELIRLGGNGDGGYLVPDDLDNIVACFSPGVDVEASFESALVARGVPCYLADGSVEGPPISDSLIHFEKKFLGVLDDKTTITMDTWVRRNASPEGDLLLQMDIEGAEWAVLLNVSDTVLARFRIIVLELHYMQRLVSEAGFELMSSALERLLRLFHVVHLHPNNARQMLNLAELSIPRMLEVTLLRSDRANACGYADYFPHPLDRANKADEPDLQLPKCWYRSE